MSKKHKPPHPSGGPAEQMFEDGLKFLMRINPLFQGYQHAKKDGELDKQQVDFLVFMGHENYVHIIIPYQVKGGNRAGAAIAEHLSKNPGVAPFRISKKDTTERIAERVQKSSYRYLRRFFLDNPSVRKLVEEAMRTSNTSSS